jgi:hypothetical protein
MNSFLEISSTKYASSFGISVELVPSNIEPEKKNNKQKLIEPLNMVSPFVSFSVRINPL